MDYITKDNTTSMDLESFQSPMTYGVAAFVAMFFSLLAFVSYSPRTDKKAPRFTLDTSPIIGSFGYATRQWSFWKSAIAESKTGNFSFWLGTRHIVGITGHAARKMFYDNPNLDFVSGTFIMAFGVHFWYRIHEIFRTGYARGRSNTFFLKRLTELMKTDQLNKCLPNLIGDARASFEVLLEENPSGVIQPPGTWRTVLKQNCRMFFTDEVVDNAELFEELSGYIDVALHTFSTYNVFIPWLPSGSYLRRRWARRGLVKIVTKIVNERMKPGAPRIDDPVQILIDNGDKKEWIIEFFVSVMFISSTNAHVMASQMLNILAIHTNWQERILGEIEAVADLHCKDKDATLVEKLKTVPLEGWDNSIPSLDLCLKEAIRMWTSFCVMRYNMSKEPIPIPGTNEVVPGRTFVVYNSTEVNFSEELFPNPKTFDPERFLEGREEFKRQAYGFLGWGQGCHPCPATRYAKLQQTVIIANALAMYQWTSCDPNGNPDPHAEHRRELDSRHSFNLPPAYNKLVSRTEL